MTQSESELVLPLEEVRVKVEVDDDDDDVISGYFIDHSNEPLEFDDPKLTEVFVNKVDRESLGAEDSTELNDIQRKQPQNDSDPTKPINYCHVCSENFDSELNLIHHTLGNHSASQSDEDYKRLNKKRNEIVGIKRGQTLCRFCGITSANLRCHTEVSPLDIIELSKYDEMFISSFSWSI